MQYSAYSAYFVCFKNIYKVCFNNNNTYKKYFKNNNTYKICFKNIYKIYNILIT